MESFVESITNIETTSDPHHAYSKRKGRTIVLKNKLSDKCKRSFSSIMDYHKGSRLKDPEHCCFTLLQLYLPWRNESGLQSRSSSYEEKFKHIATEILPNISNHVCFDRVYEDEDLMNITLGPVDDNDTDNSSSEYGMLNPDLLVLDLSMQRNVESVIRPVSSNLEDLSVSREEFYAFCLQLNKGQQLLSNSIMKHTQQLTLNERNNLPNSNPCYIFLTGGASVVKSFLVKCVTEYMKKNLKFPVKNFSE